MRELSFKSRGFLRMLFICILTIVILVIGYVVNKEITTLEFLSMCVICILSANIIFLLTNISKLFPNDLYFESGRIKQVSYHPYFKERYEQMHVETYPCGTDSKGYVQYCTRTYYTTEYDRHPEYWLAKDTLGQACKISNAEYEKIAKEFGYNLKVNRSRVRYHHSDGKRVAGDSNLYFYNNDTNTYEYPTNKLSKWRNPLKRSSSIFNNEKQFLDYPNHKSWTSTNRNITWEGITAKEWDKFNTRIYERIKANVILVKVKSSSEAQEIKQAWNRGKKNDIVICYNGPVAKPNTVVVFGWYKTELLSSTLETFVLEHGISMNSLKGIEHIIYSYYAPFDFSTFDYLMQPPELWQLILTALITLAIMCYLYNEYSSNYDSRED